MRKMLKNKFAVGLLSGAFILAGSAMLADSVQAAETAEQDNKTVMAQEKAPVAEKPQVNIEEQAQRLANDFGVEAQQVVAYCHQGGDFHDACIAANLAKLSGKSFQEVVTVKGDEKDWHKVAQSLGVTDEMLREDRISFEAKRIADGGNVEEATALELLKDGYHGRDIEMAGRIAKAAGKNAQAVLAMKKVNNSWHDVAEAVGVSVDDLKAQGGQPGPKGPHGPQPGFGGPGLHVMDGDHRGGHGPGRGYHDGYGNGYHDGPNHDQCPPAQSNCRQAPCAAQAE